jgi:hypothetical protein
LKIELVPLAHDVLASLPRMLIFIGTNAENKT